MENTPEKTNPKPMMNPYIFTFLLLAFGLWCLWDGWISPDPEMEYYAVVMNKVAGLILIPWSVWDFFKVRQREAASKEAESDTDTDSNRG